MLYFLSWIAVVRSCSGGTGLTGETQVVQDPTFTFTVSPPVGWTYPMVPITTDTRIPAYYFPGQSLTADQAVQRASNEINAAFLEAMNNSPYVLRDAQLTVTYSPDEITNCYTGLPIASGTRIGYTAGGTVSEYIVVPSQSTSITTCPVQAGLNNFGQYMQYEKQIVASAKNTPAMTRYEWERISSQMMSQLSFKYHVQFRSAIVIS